MTRFGRALLLSLSAGPLGGGESKKTKEPEGKTLPFGTKQPLIRTDSEFHLKRALGIFHFILCSERRTRKRLPPANQGEL